MADMAQQNVSQVHSGDTRRDFLIPDSWGDRRRRGRRDHLAVRRHLEPGTRHIGAVDYRGRSRADPGRPTPDRRVARQTGVYRPPHAGGDQGRGKRRHLAAARSAKGFGPRSRIRNGLSSSVCARISAASRSVRRPATIAVRTAAGSVRATARCTTPPAASGRVRRRRTSGCPGRSKRRAKPSTNSPANTS